MISYSDHFYSNLIVHLEIKYEHYKINHTSMNYELLIPNLFENIIHDLNNALIIVICPIFAHSIRLCFKGISVASSKATMGREIRF